MAVDSLAVTHLFTLSADIDPRRQAPIKGGDDGQLHIRTAPLFEVGDERYHWLNDVQAVGVGVTYDGGVRYDIYAVD